MNDSYNYALSRQIPKEKLLLGIPFYGRSFDSSELYQKFQNSGSYSFAEIMSFLNAGWTYIWDDCAKVPYLRNPENTKIISYDDEKSVTLKCQYIIEKEAAGVIIWELSEDYYQGSSVLLNAVARGFERKGFTPRR
jgi:chitinase